ncbi:3-keto-5-aminohexanoate cleavage enzyme [Shimia gijangensis]|uniref:3-keto-5-aminohexanoate cleavage enzyme n=1 Tax=Shimia gijangensis TaxID=1470563 RepID=A0A1M6T7M7_9RHOB|nr:3-keto-5-aminohexanoate cleavage protein [Shimia gijangensis]SHK52849.1 3-keto-5-aminohexanoate cleavage enzyme [Shimia gijangensis]
MKVDLLSKDKVMITAAITGGLHGREANANLPLTPEEQAQAALDAYNAGASIVHLHVRDEQGVVSTDLKDYSNTIRLINERCPIITQVGNGIGTRVLQGGSLGAKVTNDERMNLINIEPRPDMLTVNGGTFEFRSPVSHDTFDNNHKFNIDFIEGCKARNYGLELEVYDPSHIANMLDLRNAGVLEGMLHFSIVLGIKGGSPSSVSNLIHMVSELPDDSGWQLVSIGRYHFRSNAMALAMGGNVRTGMEDTVFNEKGLPVSGNGELVEATSNLTRSMGREPATVEEARQALGLGN